MKSVLQRLLPDLPRESRREVYSWILYDFANTIYSLVVITVFFTPYIKDLTGSNETLGLVTTASMMLSGCLVPFAGAIADQTPVTKRCLVALTIVCCAATCGLSASRDPRALVPLFFVANSAYQLSLVFYNSLLTWVAPSGHLDSVNGWGVGIGYLGSLFALLAGIAVDSIFGGPRATFFMAGIGFLACSLPLFLNVRERVLPNSRPVSRDLFRSSLRRTVTTIRSLPSSPALLLFLLGNFLSVDALNTMIQFINETLRDFLGITEPGPRYLTLIGLQVAAFPFGVLSGWLCRRLGGRIAYVAANAALLLAIGACALREPRALVLPALVVMGGMGVGGVWVAGRRLVVDLAPADRLGEYFGLYGLTVKTSSTGALLFGILTARASHWHALAMLGVYLVAGSALVMASRRGGS